MTSRERKRYWIKHTNKKRRIVADFSGRFYAALKKDTDGFLHAYQSGGHNSAQAYANRMMISQNIATVMNALYREAGVRAAKEAYGDLNVQKRFGSVEEWFNAIMDYISTNFYNKGLLRITETTKKILIDILNKSVNEGWGYSELARHFEEVMPGINRNRAEMIARTESGKAIHAGTDVGADKSVWLKEKVWVAAHDNRTRGNPMNGIHDKADHWHLDGQTVLFSDNFHDSKSGEFLKHPHDPKGSAKEVVNCRCTYAVINKRDDNGNLIRKS